MTRQHNSKWGRRIIGLGAAAVTAALFALPTAAGADPGQADSEPVFRLIEPAAPSGGRVLVPGDPASSPTPLIDPVLVGRA